jgi:hypothetical protein
MLGHNLDCRVAVEDLLAGQEIVGDAPECVEVCSSVQAVAQRHFGGHLAWRSRQQAGLRVQRLLDASVSDRLQQAEVEDLTKS